MARTWLLWRAADPKDAGRTLCSFDNPLKENEQVRVIEKSAYDALMEQANKLASALDWVINNPDDPALDMVITTAVFNFQKFKGGQE